MATRWGRAVLSRRRKKGGLPTGYRVAEVYFERRGGRSIVGNIYKGKVDNVLPGLEAAFVDIGYTKNAFLHYWDMLPAAADSESGSTSSTRQRPKCLSPSGPVMK